jgi:2-dehydro-3-deoxygluconokinase
LSASHNTWSGVLWTRPEQGRRANFFTAPTYEILPIVDRVGGGDAFMSGLIYGLRKYKDDPQKALDFAAAAACLKHSVIGDFNAVSVSEVEALMAGDASGRVSR